MSSHCLLIVAKLVLYNSKRFVFLLLFFYLHCCLLVVYTVFLCILLIEFMLIYTSLFLQRSNILLYFITTVCSPLPSGHLLCFQFFVTYNIFVYMEPFLSL